MKRAAIRMENGELWLETKAGSKDYRRITEPFAVVRWNPENIYRVSDAIRFFKTTRAADKFAGKSADTVVRTVAYMRAD